MEKRIRQLMAYAEENEADSSFLDEMVIDCKCSEASAINNEGIEAQIRYLLVELGASAENLIKAELGPK